jgi:C-8 sterol isomerase
MRYIFDPQVVHDCAMVGVQSGKPVPEIFDVVIDALEERYPTHIDRSQPWLYSIAGGAMIQMKLYFTSLMEYIMIWGTPIGSEGHSGRHAVGFWDTVLAGEMWYYAEGQFDRRVYKPGDRVYVGPGQARAMNFTDGVWALEYERGPLPLSLPFGLADVLLSTLDFATAVQTVGLYMTLTGRHWTNPNAPCNPLLRPLKQLAGIVPASLGPIITQLSTPAPATDGIPSGSDGLLQPSGSPCAHHTGGNPPCAQRTDAGSPRASQVTASGAITGMGTLSGAQAPRADA